MSIAVADLFVNLGVRGVDDTVKKISNVKSGIGEVKEMSLATKAAIVGMLYGLERLVSVSNQAGTAMTSFGAATGLSMQRLQEFQYAGQTVGVSHEETLNTIKGIQSAIANMKAGKGAPEALAWFRSIPANVINGPDGPYRLIEVLQSQLKKMPKDLARILLPSLNIGDNVNAAMQRGVYNKKVYDEAPKYSDKQLQEFTKIGAGWALLFQKVQMIIGNLNAEHGLELVQSLNTIIDAMGRLTMALNELAKFLQVPNAINGTIRGSAQMLNDEAGFFENLYNLKGKKAADAFGKFGLNTLRLMQHKPPIARPAQENKTINNNVTQTYNNNNQTPEQAAALNKNQQVPEAFWQSPAVSGGE